MQVDESDLKDCTMQRHEMKKSQHLQKIKDVLIVKIRTNDKTDVSNYS